MLHTIWSRLTGKAVATPDELLGYWRPYDDGSEQLFLYGHALEFMSDGSGQYHWWGSLADDDELPSPGYHFRWRRVGNNALEISKEGESVSAPFVATYQLRHTSMGNMQLDISISHEPLYQQLQGRALRRHVLGC